MQDMLGSVWRSLVFRTSSQDGEDSPSPIGVGGGPTSTFVEKINSCIRKSRVFSKPSPPLASLSPSPPPMAKDNTPPIRWRKGELIGCGAFGRVYMGMNLDSGELLAVKQVLIAANTASKKKTQAHIKELEEEVKLLKNLSHPNIVRYLGTVTEEETLNLLLEFVPGGSISSLLGKFGSFPEAVVRTYTKQLLLGLSYLHKNGIMHRDIKGANILVDNKGCIKLADFGASKQVVELATISGAKSMKGTPYWMAPEVILQTGHSFSADIWSVGCTVIEMATGKPPWSQQFQEMAALFHIGTTKSHPPIPEQLSVEAKDFLLKCLQKEPNLRPAASELLQHPFVTGEPMESHHAFCTSMMENSETSSPWNTKDLETYKMVTCLETAGDCNLGSLNCSTVSPEKSLKSKHLWRINSSNDDMCQIDDSNDISMGEGGLCSSLMPDNFKSFNPISEPSDDWVCKLAASPEAECEGINLDPDQKIHLRGGCSETFNDRDKDFSFHCRPSLSEDDEELTESKIRAFLDEKILLLALSFWSFHFESLCAFGLVAYVGYILYIFPTMLHFHRLNGLLLVFILLWAASTYVFNVASTVLHKKLHKDMEIWETIGLWHYPIPGFYLLAQFGLGVLVALGNLVNNSVLLHLSDRDGPSTNNSSSVEEKEETLVYAVATIAWGVRKSSRAVVLALTFLIATKPGFIHAIYMVFFMIYLLSHSISKKMRQTLILLCEAHFALIYILQLNLISKALEQKGSFLREILSELGLLNQTSAADFLEIALLACFCSMQNHGFDMLSSFSAIVQQAPCPPIGFRTLRAGLIKSVLLSVYSSTSKDRQQINSSRERMITLYLSAIGQKFLTIYRSCGTYIASMTIFLTVYLVVPNYTSFGYLFFLLIWLIGRQILRETRRRLWFPLKLYAVAVLVFIYSISVFINFQTWLSNIINLESAFGYKKEASVLKNIWESLAIIVVMQLYSYERRQSKFFKLDDSDAQEIRAFSFVKRLMIWHSEKILFLALFYASLSPISATGFLYLLGLVICSMLPKTSRIPSTLFLIYSGFLAVIEYLFQMWGDKAEMFPDQKHFYLSQFLGLQFYGSGFSGIEAGLRRKVLVIAACIFMLVSLQSYMFSSKEFDYVSSYLEAEQIGAIVREQEKRAAWKTAQLQCIRKAEEQKCLRNLQVEKMKSEMLNLKVQLDSVSVTANRGNSSPEHQGIRKDRKYSLDSYRPNGVSGNVENGLKGQDLGLTTLFDMIESPRSEGSSISLEVQSAKHSTDTLYGITELEMKAPNYKFMGSDGKGKGTYKAKRNPIASAVHLIGGGVSHVQSLGNKAANNLMHFLNIEKEEHELSENSSDDEEYYEIESQNIILEPTEGTSSIQSGFERTMSEATYSEIGMILRYMWGQMRSNNDVVCYCCFLLIFLWNFSLLSMVYIMALFLYALCINTGPSYMFWVVMLIYTEGCILLQYVYQIIIQHCGFTINMSFLQELGFPAHRIMSSFVTSNLPLFLVYLFTLLQTSITTKDGDWKTVTEFIFRKKNKNSEQDEIETYSYSDRIRRLLLPVKNVMRLLIRSLFRYWKSLTQGAETPPYFVQLSMEVYSVAR